MPQMMPLNWMMLYLMFMFIFLFFMMIIYYMYNLNSPKMKKMLINYINYNWKW
uniref:ATP synthase F0 subunit 8 n=1 Tax=Triaenodes tardus TaxID=763371 RepID=A0A3B1EW11_9NEOP|nr:ATP synthase F0 subunit 8 [Triaenodes tardus]AXU98788.1 ATP synthase F0 subunit 8 [Triaenodes tardus]